MPESHKTRLHAPLKVRIFAAAAAAIVISASGTTAAFASYIYQQPDATQSHLFDATYNEIFQPMGTGTGQTMQSMGIYRFNSANALSAQSFGLFECSGAPASTGSYTAITAGCSLVVGGVTNATSSVASYLVTNSTYTLSSSKFYLLWYEGVNAFSSPTTVFGSATSSGYSSFCYSNSGTTQYSCGFSSLASFLSDSSSNVQSIRFSSPTDGQRIDSSSVTVSVNYSNPAHYATLQFCFYNPDTLASLGGTNPCTSDSFSLSATATGTATFLYTNTASTSHQVLSVGFGLSLDYIPSGVRYSDYDSASIGFYSNAALTVATGTPSSFSPYAGLDCGGFNLVDNLKCAGVFLFYPDTKLLQSYRNLSLASTSPFGYAYAATGLVENIWAGSGSPIAISMDFTDLQTTLQTISPTVTVATTSVVVFNSCWASNYRGVDYYDTYIMPFIRASLWLGFFWTLYQLSHSIF